MLLFTLLSSIALAVPSDSLKPYQHLQPTLQNLLQDYGDSALFALPKSRHTILALELIAEYRPLALVRTQDAAALSLKGETYIVLAKYIASELQMEHAAGKLIQQRDSADRDTLEQLALDCLQWLNLTMLEIRLSSRPQGLDLIKHEANMSLSASLNILLPVMEQGFLPPTACFALHRLRLFVDMTQAVSRITSDWRNIEVLSDAIVSHKSTCEKRKQEFDITLGNLFDDDGGAEEAFAISSLHDSIFYRHHTEVSGLALFCAIMSGTRSHNTGELDPEEVINLTDHIIDGLKSQSAQGQDRHPVRLFLEQYAEARTDQLEKMLTDFISMMELKLQDVPYNGPTRRVASELLFTCKEIVDGHAARLKGWGVMHPRIDTHLILFEECARCLEKMETGAGDRDAIFKGSLLAASAKLIRDLNQIAKGWKRKLTDNQRRNAGKGANSTNNAPLANLYSTAADSGTGGNSVSDTATDLNDSFSSDLFADWKNWPQLDDCDFSQFFPDDFNQY